MGVLDRFEKRIEQVVNGAFAKAFRAQVEPVELAGALRKESDTRAAVVSRGRTLTANSYTIELAPGDFERLSPIFVELRNDLRQVVGEHAVEQGYSFVGPVGVSLDEADDLDTGMYRVRSKTSRPDGSVAAQPANRGGYDPESRAHPVVPEAYEQSQRQRASQPVPTGGPRRSRAAAGTHEFSVSVGGERYRLDQGSTVFGRSSNSADIVIDDPGVSRRHFEITISGEHATASDLGSTNGTLLDGRRITSVTLTNGVKLVAGDTPVIFSEEELAGQ